MEHISKSLEETAKIADEMAEKIGSHSALASRDKATVVGLYGDLGAGKTTFMKYFAKHFGVEEEVQSPTFIIMRIFEIPKSKMEGENLKFNKLIHIDAYRLESGEELLKLGWNELISHPNNLICVEWPEKVSEILPEHFMLRFEHSESENERKISLA
jgi:tRNA threonylcarbamoyladenosine biosynthesis protein TsaE